MSLESIVAEIDSEIGRLEQAKQLLSSVVNMKTPGRPRGKVVAAIVSLKPKRTLSASARAKIAAAQKARWAKARKGASNNGVLKSGGSK
jgi:hypothetical protein